MVKSAPVLVHDDMAGSLARASLTDRQRTIRRILRLKGGIIGGVVTLLVILIAVFGPLVMPHDPVQGYMLDRLKPPIWLGGSSKYLLGTDPLGRDELSRLVLGARVSLEAGASGTLIAAIIGVTLGVLSGYFKRRVGLDHLKFRQYNVGVPIRSACIGGHCGARHQFPKSDHRLSVDRLAHLHSSGAFGSQCSAR